MEFYFVVTKLLIHTVKNFFVQDLILLINQQSKHLILIFLILWKISYLKDPLNPPPKKNNNKNSVYLKIQRHILNILDQLYCNNDQIDVIRAGGYAEGFRI